MIIKRAELAPLVAARELWLLVSVASVDPYHRERLAVLCDPAFRERTIQAARLLAQEQREVELGPGEADARRLSPERLFAAFTAECDTLDKFYRQLFGLTSISQRCPPCGIEYDPNTDVTYRSQQLADVSGFYQAFGLQTAARASERLDHLSVEAEFLYVLLAKEAAALDSGNQEGVEICRDARRKFFRDHVGWWLPAFSRILSHIATSAYYRELATLTASLSAFERVSLGLPTFQGRFAPKPSAEEPPPARLGCMSGQDRGGSP